MSAVISWFKGVSYYVLRFDIVESESLVLTTEVTSHAVEVGANISDHARDAAPTASLSVFISQKPIEGRSLTKPGLSDAFPQPELLRFPAYSPTFTPTPGGLSQAVGGLISGPPPTMQSVSVLKFTAILNRPEIIIQALEKLRSSYQLIEVNAPSWSLQDCLITSISVDRDPETGAGVAIGIDVQAIRRASSKRSAAALPAEPKARKLADKGKKGGEEVEVDEGGLLYKALGGGKFSPK